MSTRTSFCSNCKRSPAAPTGATSTECRRYAPKPMEMVDNPRVSEQRMQFVAVWPIVQLDGWCGEWAQR